METKAALELRKGRKESKGRPKRTEDQTHSPVNQDIKTKKMKNERRMP